MDAKHWANRGVFCWEFSNTGKLGKYYYEKKSTRHADPKSKGELIMICLIKTAPDITV